MALGPTARTRIRWGLAAFAGLVLACTGLGLAPQYVTRTGWSLGSAIGVVTLVGGLVLLVIATVRLLRTARRWRKLWALPVAFVALELVAIPWFTAVVTTQVARPSLGDRTPADVGLDARDVTFPTTDGVTLAGWYVPSRTGAAVVLRHGASSTRTAVLDQAAVLAEHGYGVLMADARGNGESGGEGMALGWHGDADTEAAVSFLAGQPDVDADRIGAVGLSMGGEEAIGAAAADPRIRAVVAEGATARSSADHGWESNPLADLMGWITTSLTDLLTPASPPTTLRDAVAGAAPTPFLLVVAGDVAQEGEAAEWIRSGAPDTVTVWEVEDAGHTAGLRTDPDGWEERVIGFLDDALGVNRP
jgi:dienelactone hydrolase